MKRQSGKRRFNRLSTIWWGAQACICLVFALGLSKKLLPLSIWLTIAIFMWLYGGNRRAIKNMAGLIYFSYSMLFVLLTLRIALYDSYGWEGFVSICAFIIAVINVIFSVSHLKICVEAYNKRKGYKYGKRIALSIALLFTTLIFVIFFFPKATTIYVIDAANTVPIYDITVKVDGNVILDDSLASGNPYVPNFVLEEKIRYGFHEIHVSSDRLRVKHEETVFLFPDRYIAIEILPADSLSFHHYRFSSSMWTDDVELTDSIMELYKPSIGTLSRDSSEVSIWADFNPFRTL